jgi:hypothetical protein
VPKRAREADHAAIAATTKVANAQTQRRPRVRV